MPIGRSTTHCHYVGTVNTTYHCVLDFIVKFSQIYEYQRDNCSVNCMLKVLFTNIPMNYHVQNSM